MTTEHYQVAIIEDDTEQQELVKGLLQAYEGTFEVIGLAEDINAGRDLLSRHQPDLVILDVMLGDHDCFELLNSLNSIPFKIIFTTSHDDFAVRAFRVSAIDYLLKPLDPGEFHLAIDKFRNRKEDEEGSARVRNMLSNMQAVEADHARVALPTLNGFLYLPIRDIVRCESDNTYTVFFTVDRRKLVVSRTLKDCELQLSDFGFFRIHNSHMVNLKYVTEYIKGEGGVVRMIDGSTMDVSRRRKVEFLQHLNKL
jgi:two-component system, LytTR family, response regulator